MESIVIRRVVDLLLSLAVVKAFGPVQNFRQIVDRFMAMSDIGQIGVVVASVLICGSIVSLISDMREAKRRSSTGHNTHAGNE